MRCVSRERRCSREAPSCIRRTNASALRNIASQPTARGGRVANLIIENSDQSWSNLWDLEGGWDTEAPLLPSGKYAPLFTRADVGVVGYELRRRRDRQAGMEMDERGYGWDR